MLYAAKQQLRVTALTLITVCVAGLAACNVSNHSPVNPQQITSSSATPVKQSVVGELQLEALSSEIESRSTSQELGPRELSKETGLSIADSHYWLIHVETRLPRYQELFEAAGQETGLDWRLLAAVSYQESLWDHDAISPTGVKGLMMLTHITAKEMGVSQRTNPEQSAMGGAAYLKKLYDRFDDIPEQERMWFALAAYNAGYGHIRNAMQITRLQGNNSKQFAAVVPHLAKLGEPLHQESTRYGYARGAKQAIYYVNRIQKFYTAFQLNFQQWPEEFIALAKVPNSTPRS